MTTQSETQPNLSAPAYAAASDTGRVREHNEDYAYAGPVPGAEGWVLLMVADGVGGHSHGEWASQMAIENVARQIGARLTTPTGAADPGALLAATVEETSRAIWEEANRLYGGPGPATTLVAALVKDSKAWWVNVGDSRIYLVRKAEVMQISRDHSWVADQVRAGLMNESEAERHPRKNIITRTVGFDRDVVADKGGPLQLEPGESLLLCSDGLHGPVAAASLGAVVSDLEPARAAARLVELANEAGGPDNITVVIYRATNAGVPSPVETARVPIPDAPGSEVALPRRRRWIFAGLAALIAGAAIAAGVLIASSMV